VQNTLLIIFHRFCASFCLFSSSLFAPLLNKDVCDVRRYRGGPGCGVHAQRGLQHDVRPCRHRPRSLRRRPSPTADHHHVTTGQRPARRPGRGPGDHPVSVWIGRGVRRETRGRLDHRPSSLPQRPRVRVRAPSVDLHTPTRRPACLLKYFLKTTALDLGSRSDRPRH